ncbi:30S ribosomal protein S24e [Methanococcus aeolicus]|jgi:ribosomal protein S24E|uniref:Small ribosomal subunit protein eS24 n=1 Tax=Methanococcus aeolicus (strain ATCC BAA-1280 / DSM 17508 / OCM 812 / Nankai-3) TaxID=419665 RepID=RS24_META3|nr:30S ribosomal protein S24e [Methanococcus aeolicus]A6UTQ0.1 RecName: Full=Small ribosomal subunit protein eS24; AltName: Full=30S ribosomal protein S24e [Methanococcus aeolicus Nankai-3]ABR55872.1 Ribosomal protein S24e [Methanococcus aeolicus Nankai-3]UXM84023.1 30S ribosomal protein S24e [Methanococcus aeolicus]
MEIKITSDRANPLLHRREVKFIANYDGTTPSVNEIKMKITAMLNADKSLTIVDSICQEYGNTESLGYVKIYDDEKSMNLFEKKSVLEKNKIEEAETTEEDGE